MLSSKVALITGAAQGIGLATARLLLKNGARVSMVDLSEQIGKAACAELQRDYSAKDVSFFCTDVTKKEQLRAAFEGTMKTFGGIDIVCNNAGIGDESQWRKMVDINLVAVIEGTFLALEHMSTRKGGKGGAIVNISSFGGIVPMPFAPTYSASKHGVVGFSRSLADCITTDGVRVNCLCPEFVDTRLVRESLNQATPEVKSFMLETIGLLSPEKVAEGIFQLITDTSKSGAVMTVTKRRGIDFFPLPGDKNFRSKM